MKPLYLHNLRSRSSSQIYGWRQAQVLLCLSPKLPVTVLQYEKLRDEGCLPSVPWSLRATTVPPDGFQCLLRDVAGALASPRRRGPSVPRTLTARRAQPRSPPAGRYSDSSEGFLIEREKGEKDCWWLDFSILSFLWILLCIRSMNKSASSNCFSVKYRFYVNWLQCINVIISNLKMCLIIHL